MIDRVDTVIVYIFITIFFCVIIWSIEVASIMFVDVVVIDMSIIIKIINIGGIIVVSVTGLLSVNISFGESLAT